MNHIDEIIEREFPPHKLHDVRRYMIDELRALLQEAVEAERKDAERYRWLRNKSHGQFDHPFVAEQRTKQEPRYLGPLCFDNLDRAIDAAIAAEGK